MAIFRKIFLMATLLASLSFADRQSDIEALKQEKEQLKTSIKKLNEKIASTDSLIAIDDKRFQAQKTRFEEDLKRRKAEIDDLSEKINQTAKELKQAREKERRAKGREDDIFSKRKALAEAMLSISRALEAQIERSIPWDKEARKARANALSRDIESKNADEEEIFSRLKALFIEEIRFGDEIVLINAPLTRKNGELINAQILRLGGQWMVYSDENHTVYGNLTKTKNGFEWNENLNLEERQAIKLALDVKQAKKPPQIVWLPVSLSVFREER